MDGIYAFIVAILALVVSFLWGKTKGKADEKEKHASDQKTIDLQKTVTPIVAETVRKETEANKDYEHTLKAIDEAKRTNDMDAMQKIAEEQARKALSMGAKEAK